MNATARYSPRRVAALSCENQRGGFTLFEMLVTSLLSSMLILGLWSLFGTYMRLFESGQAKAEQSRLLRGLGEQLSSDLAATLSPSGIVQVRTTSPGPTSAMPAAVSSTVPADVAANASVAIPAVGGSLHGIDKAESSLPATGLVGTAHAMRLDVLVISADPDLLPRPVRPESTRRQEEPPAAPELRSVLYTFEEPRETRAADRRPPPGLVRRELGWQEFADRGGNAGNRGSLSAGDAADREIAKAFEAFDLIRPEAFESQVDDTTIWVPEVVALRFRYFDGREWRETWDSHEKASLPSAVEIVMHVRDTARNKRRGKGAAESEQPPLQAETTVSPEGDAFDEPPEDPNLLIYRDVVLLRHAALLHAQSAAGPRDRPFASLNRQTLNAGGAQ